MRQYVLGLIVLLGASVPATADSTCQPKPAGSLDMTVGSLITVPITLGGQSFTFSIATGGPSLIDKAVLERLGIHSQRLTGLGFSMMGGKPIENFAVLRDIDLGGRNIGATAFLVAPDSMLPDGIQGTIAPDLLRTFDVELDFAHLKLNLFELDYCNGSPVYWTKDPFTEIAFPLDSFGFVRFPVLLDGKEIKIELEAGASKTFFDLETAEQAFGFDSNDPRLAKLYKTAHGYAYSFPFKTLGAGKVSVADPAIILMSNQDSRMGPEFHGMVGLDVLRRLHIYLSYHRRKLFATDVDAH